MSCVQLSEGGFQVIYPLGLRSRSSGVVKVLYMDMASKLFSFTFTYVDAVRTCMHDVGTGNRQLKHRSTADC